MQVLRFVKYHGLGNDFIVVDTDTPASWTREQARALCDRHRGVGADGVLLVGPGAARTRASMRVLNADGSEPEMCGNGLRCVALHLALADDAVETSFVVQTGAGLLGCAVSRQGSNASVKLEMGRVELTGELSFESQDRLLVFQRVSTGNPHAILFDSTFDAAGIDRLAPLVSGAIAGGSNVEFVEQLGPSRLRVSVWERGVGRTLACGTGAVAVVAAAAARGRVAHDHPVTVELPGGLLTIELDPELRARLEGPAVRVFSGEVAV